MISSNADLAFLFSPTLSDLFPDDDDDDDKEEEEEEVEEEAEDEEEETDMDLSVSCLPTPVSSPFMLGFLNALASAEVFLKNSNKISKQTNIVKTGMLVASYGKQPQIKGCK